MPEMTMIMYLTVAQLNQLNICELSKKMSNENQKTGFVTLVILTFQTGTVVRRSSRTPFQVQCKYRLVNKLYLFPSEVI